MDYIQQLTQRYEDAQLAWIEAKNSRYGRVRAARKKWRDLYWTRHDYVQARYAAGTLLDVGCPTPYPTDDAVKKRMSKMREHDEIVRLYNDGWTLPTIARQTHMSLRHIRRIVKDARASGRITRPKSKRGRVPLNAEEKLEDDRLNRQIADLYNQHHTQKAISQKVGFSSATIRRRIGILREQGLIERDGNRVFSEENRAHVVRRYNDGWTIPRIEEETGISSTHISRILGAAREAGRVSRPPYQAGKSRENAQIDQQVAAQYNQYVPVKTIAAQLNLSTSAIKRRIKRMRDDGQLITRPPRYDFRTQKAKDRYKRLLLMQTDEGLSSAEIAEREGIGVASVRRVLGIAKRMYPHLVKSNTREMRKRKAQDLQDEGVHKITIAQTLGLHIKTIEQYLREDMKEEVDKQGN